MKNKKALFKVFSLVLLIMFLADFMILSFLPKVAAHISLMVGYKLSSNDLMTRYSMGIGVRVIGLLLFSYIIKKADLFRWYTCKIDKKCLMISWLFIIYIMGNLEVNSLEGVGIVPLLMMMIESLVIGLYEETVFRGTILPFFLRLWGNSTKKVLFSVLMSSLLFGLFHLTNLLTGDDLLAVLSQVCYTAIMGVAFSTLFLRTKGNLLWCGMMHGLYDMAAGFGELSPILEPELPQTITADAWPYLLNLGLFIPLLIYGLFLLRKVQSVTTSGEIYIQ